MCHLASGRRRRSYVTALITDENDLAGAQIQFLTLVTRFLKRIILQTTTSNAIL